jgi:hypothetical protein
MRDRSMTAKSAASRRAAPRSLRLPAGLTAEQEATWWDAHPEYWDQRPGGRGDKLVAPAASPPARRTHPVSLRLPVDMIDALKREAARRDLPYQTLIRVWLREQLDRHHDVPAALDPRQVNAGRQLRTRRSSPPEDTRKSADQPAPAQVAETKPRYSARTRRA